MPLVFCRQDGVGHWRLQRDRGGVGSAAGHAAGCARHPQCASRTATAAVGARNSGSWRPRRLCSSGRLAQLRRCPARRVPGGRRRRAGGRVERWGKPRRRGVRQSACATDRQRVEREPPRHHVHRARAVDRGNDTAVHRGDLVTRCLSRPAGRHGVRRHQGRSVQFCGWAAGGDAARVPHSGAPDVRLSGVRAHAGHRAPPAPQTLSHGS
eukprot:ctg_340.g234